jgi:hypothetical protein
VSAERRKRPRLHVLVVDEQVVGVQRTSSAT